MIQSISVLIILLSQLRRNDEDHMLAVCERFFLGAVNRVAFFIIGAENCSA